MHLTTTILLDFRRQPTSVFFISLYAVVLVWNTSLYSVSGLVVYPADKLLSIQGNSLYRPIRYIAYL